MQLIEIEGKSEISHTILKKYHFSAQGIHDIRLEKDEALEVEYSFKINIPAESIDDAKNIFLNYLNKLNNLGVIYHLGHLVYITQNLIDFEGNFADEEAPLHDKLLEEINLLIKLINLNKEALSGKLILEVTHKSHGKEFEDYIKINSTELIKEATFASATALLASIKQNPQLHPYSVQNLIANLENLDLVKLEEIKGHLISISDKSFKAQFLYTLCVILRNYLNDESPLTHPTANLTNDQARVIYETCKIHGLITLPHEMDIEKVNYIRAIINNRANCETMNAIFVDS